MTFGSVWFRYECGSHVHLYIYCWSLCDEWYVILYFWFGYFRTNTLLFVRKTFHYKLCSFLKIDPAILMFWQVLLIFMRCAVDKVPQRLIWEIQFCLSVHCIFVCTYTELLNLFFLIIKLIYHVHTFRAIWFFFCNFAAQNLWSKNWLIWGNHPFVAILKKLLKMNESRHKFLLRVHIYSLFR